MNPLPNRPLLNNTSLPLSLPNVPSFEQIAYNGRPRKVMPEPGKEFPLLNGGVSIMAGSSSASSSAGSQMSSMERNNPLGGSGGGMMQSQQSQMQQHPQPGTSQGHQPLSHNQEKDGDEPGRLTAIFRPDDAGEWKERLRLSHEADQHARQAGAAAWDRPMDDDGKDEEFEVEDEDTGVVGDGEGKKVWKAKRTLRKLVT